MVCLNQFEIYIMFNFTLPLDAVASVDTLSETDDSRVQECRQKRFSNILNGLFRYV